MTEKPRKIGIIRVDEREASWLKRLGGKRRIIIMMRLEPRRRQHFISRRKHFRMVGLIGFPWAEPPPARKPERLQKFEKIY